MWHMAIAVRGNETCTRKHGILGQAQTRVGEGLVTSDHDGIHRRGRIGAYREARSGEFLRQRLRAEHKHGPQIA